MNDLISKETVKVSPDRPIGFDNMNLESANTGTVMIEAQRAVTEAQGKLIIAKRFPRDETAAYQRAKEACMRPELAEKAFFQYSRGGSTVSGPSIKLAEELSRCYGNIEYGLKELSRDAGKTEMQAYAWDMEANTIVTQNFTSYHKRETKKGTVALTSERDIYENNTNLGSRRKRACILAVLPAHYVEMAINECKKTLAGNNDTPIIDRIRKMVSAFEKIGVSKKQIEERMKHHVDETTTDELVEYIGIFNSIKEKMSTVADWFGGETKEKSDLDELLAAEIEKEKSK